METNDFLEYMADFPVGYVQYGKAKQFCAVWDDYVNMPESDLFTAAIYY